MSDAARAELIRTPPAEFVAVRNRIVADLKAAGDADAAKRIAKLRRPALVDWALNATAGEQPELAAEWAAAAATARDAGGAGLKAAITALRDATVEVARAVGDRAPSGDVAQALTRIAADADAAAAFAAGSLGFDAGDVGGAVPSAATATAARRRPRAAADDDREAARAAARARAVDAAAAELTDAEAAHDDAERTLADTAAELDAARGRVQAAERAHLAAQRKLAAARRLVAEASSELDAATRAAG